MYRILVTGGRDLPEPEIVWIPLWLALHQHRDLIVTHGDAPHGADSYAHQWFEMPDQPFNRSPRRYERYEEYLAIEQRRPADWKDRSLGKHAGNVRNQQMVDMNPMHDVVYAFPTPKSSGTLDCMARAWVRGITVVIWDHLTPCVSRVLKEDEGEQLARRRLHWGR